MTAQLAPSRPRSQFTRLSPLHIAPPLVGLLAFLASSSAGGAAVLSVSVEQSTQPEAQSVHVERISGVAVTVSDLDEAVAWYTDAVGATLESIGEESGESFERTMGVFGARARVARMRIGNERLDLVEFLSPAGRPMPVDSRGNDAWFQHIAIIVRDMDEAFEHLRQRGTRFASSGPQRIPEWNTAAAGIEAFYFRDPDGHFLEILAFPPGKGEERWQKNDSLFLGIDHTAIVVSNTEESLRFYRDTLGLRVAGESENFGTEQEHLNAVFAARLRITALRASEGPAVELLEYLTPRTGRDAPPDSTPADLWHWHVVVDVADAEPCFEAVRHGGGAPVSPGAQSFAWPGATEHTESLLARDPDGHALLFRGVSDHHTSNSRHDQRTHGARP